LIFPNHQVYFLLPEFPGYSLYKNHSGSIDTRICEDLDSILGFLVNRGFQEEKIVVMGRSIGSGPACFLAKKRKLGALVLISPFTSLQSAAKSMFGGFCGSFVKERFDNLACMPKIRCPTMILHGKKDTVIPFSQAEQLYRTLLLIPSLIFFYL
jgi:abhydrolase domain-containing protein 17